MVTPWENSFEYSIGMIIAFLVCALWIWIVSKPARNTTEGRVLSYIIISGALFGAGLWTFVAYGIWRNLQ